VVCIPHDLGVQMERGDHSGSQQVKVPAPSDRTDPPGKELFIKHCARCHNMKLEKKSTGPALLGVQYRIPPGEWIYKFVWDAPALIKSGDAYAVQVWQANGRKKMDPNPKLTREEITAIMAWITAYRPMGAIPGSR
jgi:cytochrome c2